MKNPKLPSAHKLPPAKVCLALLAICLTGLWAIPALGQYTRNWTGRDDGYWGNPNNWNPYGTPEVGEILQFGAVADANRMMTNDMFGLQVTNLFFTHNSYTISGNAIATAQVYNSADDYSDNGSFTTTINCPLDFTGYYGQIFSEAPNGTLTQSTLTFHLNGPITIGSGGLNIFADYYSDNSSVGGGNSHIYLSGPISGNGNVSAWANADFYNLNYSSIQFDGAEGNTFTGTLFPQAAGGAMVIFDKSSGFVATNSVAITGDYVADVELAAANQIGNNANLTFYGGGHLALSGSYNITVGSIIFSNLEEVGNVDCTLDTGSLTVGLNGGISAASYDQGAIPTIKGKINFNGLLPVEIDGSSAPGLDMQAVVEGAGFNKMGNNSLQLDANNTFYGNLEISAGYVIPTNAAALSASASAGVILNGGTLSLNGLAVNTDPLFVNSSNSTLITYGTCSWGGPVTLNQTLNLIPEDTTLSGLVTTFSGAITGSGGMYFEPVFLAAGNVEFSGSSANSFSGPLTVQCHNVYLNKPAHTEAFGGPLIVGGGPGPVCQVSWMNHYQGPNEATVTVYTNGIVDLNGHNDNFGPVNFNAGVIETFAGQLSLFGTVTVNPASDIAYLAGNITLPPGNPVEFNVPPGYSAGNVDFICETSISGAAPSLIKQGNGNMSITEPNTSQATTLVQEGTLDMDNASALSTTPVVISGGATLKLDVDATLNQGFEMSGDGAYLDGYLGALDLAPSVSVTLNGSVLLDAETSLSAGAGGDLSLDGLISGTGPLTKIGPGTLTMGGTSANTYAGTTFVNEGSLVITKPNNIKAVPGNLVIGTKTSPLGNSGTTATGQGVTGSIGGTNLTVNGGSTYSLVNGGLQFLNSVTLVNGGSIQTGTGSLELTAGVGANVVNVNPGQSGASVISGNVYLINGGNFAVAGRSTGGTTPELDLQAGLNDQIASGISKSGAGQLRLSAANVFSSAMTVNSGTLTLPNSGSLGNSPSTTVNNNSILALQNGISIPNNSLTLNSTNPATLESLSGSNTWGGNITLSQTGSVLIGPASGFLDLPGAISGPGGLTTGGTGTLQLVGTNANTYAGLTTVASGVLEAARYAISIRKHIAVGGGYYYTTNQISQTCIPGDVVIGSDAPGSPTASLQIDYLQQFPTTANIADHLSGSLNFVYLGAGQLQPANDTIQSLIGSGQVNLVLNSSLSISGSSSFTYNGSVNGAGAFGFDGLGTMTTWGNINTTGGVGVGSGDWEFFGARHNGGIGITGGRLGGDGTVDGAVTVVGVISNATMAVDSHLANPQGSTFHAGSLSNGPSAIIQLDMFGPSPTGGNDQILTTSGGVTLASDTILQTSFSYPPQAGDVIDLISVPSGQTITGTFANFPEGALTLVGQTPVLSSYHGGAGHDFTLTVTNLALAYTGYTLAEGNGNQTVEPDECNLLYVSLVNRRTNPVTITNAYLRATTPLGVVVTIPVATYPTILAGQTATNATPFQFKTDTNLPCGGAVAFELVLGVVNEGQFAIDFSPVSGTDCSHPTGPCDSCNAVFGQFTANTPTTANALYFTGAPSICYPPKAYPGTNPLVTINPVPYLTHNFTNSTTNALFVTAELDFACPSAPTNALGVAAYLGTFDPNNPSIGYLGDIGRGGPPYPVFSFQVPVATNFTLVVMAQTTNLPCNYYGLQVFGLPCPAPILAITNEPAPDKVRVHWSTAYPGWTVQQKGGLNSAFSNATLVPTIISGQYVLTNITITTNQFYRLKK